MPRVAAINARVGIFRMSFVIGALLLQFKQTSCLPPSALRVELVADPRFRHEVAWVRRIGLELLTQLPHEDAQVLRLFLRSLAPHRFEQRAVAKDTVGMA